MIDLFKIALCGLRGEEGGTTLIAGGVQGAEAGHYTRSKVTFFLMSLTLTEPTFKNFQSNKWSFMTNFVMDPQTGDSVDFVDVSDETLF